MRMSDKTRIAFVIDRIIADVIGVDQKFFLVKNHILSGRLLLQPHFCRTLIGAIE
jgi:hypothetical protein